MKFRIDCARLMQAMRAAARTASQKIENHAAAVSLYVAHYNLCRVHETIRVTPAMALGLTDHPWSIAELIDAALDGRSEEPSGWQGRFLGVGAAVVRAYASSRVRNWPRE